MPKQKNLPDGKNGVNKISIRFFQQREVRAVWDDQNSKWWFSVVDVVAALNEQDDHTKNRNYWKFLKNKLKRENPELVSAANQFKLIAPDGKSRETDCLDSRGIIELAKNFPSHKASAFLDWFLYSDNTIDGQSKKKAYALFGSGILAKLEPGSVKCLQQIHGFLFGGLYDFAGQIRTKNISKGGFTFANALYFDTILPNIERMPETNFNEIINKYVEMNVAHPFLEGNGRSTRIWLDLMLKRTLRRCIDWSRIDKNAYLSAMRESVSDSAKLKALLEPALTSRIDDRETFMKGIDYSYYYESDDPALEPDGKK